MFKTGQSRCGQVEGDGLIIRRGGDIASDEDAKPVEDRSCALSERWFARETWRRRYAAAEA